MTAKLRTYLPLILISLLALLIVRYPVLSNFSKNYLGGSSYDAGLYIYLVNNVFSALTIDNWFNLKAFYPYGYTLAWSDNFILPAIVYKFFTSVLTPASSYNLLILLAGFLNSLSTYLLAKQFKLEDFSCYLLSVFICSYSFFSSQLGHPQNQFFFFVPLGIYFLNRSLVETKYFWLFSLTFFCAFLTTVYYAIFLGIFALFICLFSIKKAGLTKLIQFTGIFLIFGLIFFPFLLPYLEVQSAFGSRNLYEPLAFALTLKDYFTSYPHNLLYSFMSGNAESAFFPGVIVTGIILVSFKFKIFKSPCLYLFLALTFFNSFTKMPLFESALRLGFFVSLFFYIESKHLKLAGIAFLFSLGPVSDKFIFLDPFSLLFNYLPGFSAIRAVSRFALFAWFFLLLHGLKEFELKAISQKLTKTAPAIIIFSLLLLEQFPRTLAFEEMPEAPKILKHLPKDSNYTLIALPLAQELDNTGQVLSWAEFSKLNVNYMNWLSDSKLKIVNGYSGQRTRISKFFPSKLANFPDARSIEALKTIAGLRYIYLNKDNFEFDKAAYPDLKLLSQNGTNYLFELSSSRLLNKESYYLLPADRNKFFKIHFTASCSKNDNIEIFIRSAVGKDKTQDNVVFQQNFDRTEKSFLLDVKKPDKHKRLYPYELRFTLPENCSLQANSIEITEK